MNRPIGPFLGEDVLDDAAHFRLLRIGDSQVLRHRLALGFLRWMREMKPRPLSMDWFFAER
jgi:hypothetical protein